MTQPYSAALFPVPAQNADLCGKNKLFSFAFLFFFNFCGVVSSRSDTNSTVYCFISQITVRTNPSYFRSRVPTLSAGRLARCKGQQKLVLVRNSEESFLVSGCCVKLAARTNFFYLQKDPPEGTQRACLGSCLQAVKAQELFTAIFSFYFIRHREVVRHCHFILRAELAESTANRLCVRVLQGTLLPVGDTAVALAP